MLKLEAETQPFNLADGFVRSSLFRHGLALPCGEESPITVVVIMFDDGSSCEISVSRGSPDA